MFLGSEIRSLAAEVTGAPTDMAVRGDVLHSLDPSTGVDQLVWSAFDALDPRQRPRHWRARKAGFTEDAHEPVEDWTHGNTVAIGARGNVMLSFRHLDQVISLSSDLRTIEWRLGGVNSDFQFPDPDDRFLGQHSVVELPNGNLLLFDNGNYRPGPDFSRALELKLDFQKMTARKVWEYRHQPDVYADRLSSVYRLANDDTIVNFGFPRTPDEPTVLVEARPDGSTAWEATLVSRGARVTQYRAYSLSTLTGEYSVQSPAGGSR